MTIHLDSNFLIRLRHAGGYEDRHVRAWLAASQQLQASAIAWSEFACGPLAEAEWHLVRGALGAVLPFGEADAELAAQLFNRGGRRSRSLADCQIAASAIRAQAALATANRADFQRFAAFGLRLAPEA